MCHRIAECRLMCRSSPSYESRNLFATLRDVSAICYHRNNVGIRNHECRRNLSQSYNRFSNSSINVNVKCYHCQNLGYIAKHCKLRIAKQRKTVSTFLPNGN